MIAALRELFQSRAGSFSIDDMCKACGVFKPYDAKEKHRVWSCLGALHKAGEVQPLCM